MSRNLSSFVSWYAIINAISASQCGHHSFILHSSWVGDKPSTSKNENRPPLSRSQPDWKGFVMKLSTANFFRSGRLCFTAHCRRNQPVSMAWPKISNKVPRNIRSKIWVTLTRLSQSVHFTQIFLGRMHTKDAYTKIIWLNQIIWLQTLPPPPTRESARANNSSTKKARKYPSVK